MVVHDHDCERQDLKSIRLRVSFQTSSRLEFGVEIGFKLVLDFRFRLSKSGISLGAHFDSKFCLSQSRTSLEAYFDFKLVFQSTFYKPAWTSNSEYIDVKIHLSASRTGLEAYFHFKSRLRGQQQGWELVQIPKFIFHSQELVYKPTLISNSSFQSQRLHQTIWQKHTPPCVGNIVDALGLGGILNQLKRGWTA